MTKENIDKLWQRYKTESDLSARDELIQHYTYIIKPIVRRIMPRHNTYCDDEDLISSGAIGLLHAIEHFSPERNVSFETYATIRIRGEILDYLRTLDWATSALRHKIRNVNEAFESLEAAFHRTATECEVAASLNMPLEQVREIVTKTHIFNTISFESTINEFGLTIEVADNSDYTPENILLNEEFKHRLIKIIDELPERERLIISLFYYDGFMFKEIASILELSEGRVSQIHSKVLGKIKKLLAD